MNIQDYRNRVIADIDRKLTKCGSVRVNCYMAEFEDSYWLRDKLNKHYKSSGWDVYFISHVILSDFQIVVERSILS